MNAFTGRRFRDRLDDAVITVLAESDGRLVIREEKLGHALRWGKVDARMLEASLAAGMVVEVAALEAAEKL